jgi:hypothetical protein
MLTNDLRPLVMVYNLIELCPLISIQVFVGAQRLSGPMRSHNVMLGSGTTKLTNLILELGLGFTTKSCLLELCFVPSSLSIVDVGSVVRHVCQIHVVVHNLGRVVTGSFLTVEVRFHGLSTALDEQGTLGLGPIMFLLLSEALPARMPRQGLLCRILLQEVFLDQSSDAVHWFSSRLGLSSALSARTSSCAVRHSDRSIGRSLTS